MKGRLGSIAAILLLTGCASGLGRPVQLATAVTDADHVQRISITAHSFYFEPNRISVVRGVPVELTIRNGALLVPHDFSCSAKAAGIDIDEHVGLFHGHRMVRFTPTQAGEYPFHCDVDHHANKGMMGMLVVTE